MADAANVKKVTVEELIEKAKAPSKKAMELHPFYHGKIEVVPKCCVRDLKDFAIWYTPGVAQPCLDINKHPEAVWEHTNKGNMVAVVSDGTRVLGLGDIGPEAAIPVMEGKALIFKYLGGVDAFPICLKTKDPEKIIETVKLIQPCFGGINLEDIEQPKCFDVLDRLRADPEVEIPVWHDDQQGTATVILAGLINAVKLTGRKPSETKVVMVGAGAANVRAAYIMIKAGFTPGNIIMCDSKGTLHLGRPDAKKLELEFKQKWDLTKITNAEGVTGGIGDALKGADAFVAASKPGPGVIKPEWVKAMADDAIAFACANPVPEIWPWEALEAGAKVVATGRSDFPNQVNNSLGFPGIFRGTLDVRARTITDEMCIAAATELAKTAEEKGLRPEYIIPSMDEWEVFPREAVAVALKAEEQGIARVKKSRQELYEHAEEVIRRAREETKMRMEKGFIPMPPQ